MRRIWIFRAAADPSEVRDILDLLQAAGCGEDEIQVAEELGEPVEEADEVVVFVLSEQGILGSPAQDALSRVPKGGRRAICVWPSGSSELALPEAVNNFSYSIVDWNADRLKAALTDDDQTIFVGSNGDPLPKPETDHKECDE